MVVSVTESPTLHNNSSRINNSTNSIPSKYIYAHFNKVLVKWAFKQQSRPVRKLFEPELMVRQVRFVGAEELYSVLELVNGSLRVLERVWCSLHLNIPVSGHLGG